MARRSDNYKRNSNNVKRKTKENFSSSGKSYNSGDVYDNKNNSPRRKGSNDESWYSKYPDMVRDYASIPFNWDTGTRISVDRDSTQDDLVVPGLCLLKVAPTVGRSLNSTDPINNVADSLFRFVRKNNSTYAPYEAADMMLFIIGMAQVYSYIHYLKRVYGIMTLYAQKNRYLPDGVLEAMGIDFKDISHNLADFRGGINLLIHNAAKFAVPDNIEYLKRQAFLYSNIYVEGASIRDQMYAYDPDGFLKFTIDEETSKGKLKYTKFGDGVVLKGVDYLLDFGKQLVDSVLAYEDMRVIQSDILNAYGDRIIKLSTLEENYAITPIYNLTVLEQIQNATIFNCTMRGGSRLTDHLDVTQESTDYRGYIVSEPYFDTQDVDAWNNWSKFHPYVWNKFISTELSEVSNGYILELTRLVPGVKSKISSSTAKEAFYLYPATEIVVDAKVYYFSYPINGTGRVIANTTLHSVLPVDLSSFDEKVLEELGHRSFFKHAPMLWITRFNTDISTSDVMGYTPIANFANYTVVDNDKLAKLNEVVLFSLLAVDPVAKV